MFKAICGLVNHTGVVEVNGVHCHDRTDRMDLAYIPQRNDSDLNFPITVGELVLAGRRRFRRWWGRPTAADRAVAPEALEQGAAAPAPEHRALTELSGGQLQRAYLARALAQEASVVLLDEALSGVDQPTTAELFDVFETLAARRHHAAGRHARPGAGPPPLRALPRRQRHAARRRHAGRGARPPKCSTPRSDRQVTVHWLTDPFQAEFMQRAFIAAIIIGVVAPVVGTWVVLRRMANLGDAMSHGTLAGVGIAYAAGVNVLFGAMGAGLLIAVLLLAFSSNRRLGQETVITVLGTAFFALGVVVISRLDTGVELTHFLFGRVLTVQWSDIWLNLALGGAAVLVVVLLFGELRLATFDHVQAEQVGVRVELVQARAGAAARGRGRHQPPRRRHVMTVTMLVTPAATARLLARTLRQMTVWGVVFGVSEGVVGPDARLPPQLRARRHHRPGRRRSVRRRVRDHVAAADAAPPSSARLTRAFNTTAAKPVAMGTAATSPMLPTSVRTISTATLLAHRRVGDGLAHFAEQQQQRQRGAGVGEEQRVDRGRDVVAPDDDAPIGTAHRTSPRAAPGAARRPPTPG